jgi:hypothetical protein
MEQTQEEMNQTQKRKVLHKRTEKPKFINEGTYGCIHRPPLRCEEPSNIHSYRNKISKLLTKTHAEKEIQEYENIQRADPHNLYHLGEPETCKLGMQSTNKNPIEKCTMAPDVENSPQDFQLILLKDGGNDLDHFIKNIHSSTNKPQMLEKCWIEMHRMLRGIRMFLMNDLVHPELNQLDNMLQELNNDVSKLHDLEQGLVPEDSGVDDLPSPVAYLSYLK